MAEPTLLVLKTGSTLPDLRARRGDFEDLIVARMGLDRDAVRVVDPTRGEALPGPDPQVAVVITGSAAMVSAREPWSERSADWLRRCAERDVPILGICYGHQLLAHALGGTVGNNPRGREIGTASVRLTEAGARDPLFGILPSPFLVQATHLESVLRLPEGARVLAENDADPFQAFAIGERIWGVQFHPELDADLIRGYVRARADAIAREGLDPDALLAATADAAHGERLLRRFAQLLAG